MKEHKSIFFAVIPLTLSPKWFQPSNLIFSIRYPIPAHTANCTWKTYNT